MADIDDYNFNQIDSKDEDNLELAWGFWLADKEGINILYKLKNKEENKQLELFSHSA